MYDQRRTAFEQLAEKSYFGIILNQILNLTFNDMLTADLDGWLH